MIPLGLEVVKGVRNHLLSAAALLATMSEVKGEEEQKEESRGAKQQG
jgi:hypothetical protein